MSKLKNSNVTVTVAFPLAAPPHHRHEDKDEALESRAAPIFVGSKKAVDQEEDKDEASETRPPDKGTSWN